MKKRIFLFYFLTLFFIFILSLLWEFLLEPYLQPSFVAEFIPESTEDNWEYIKTIMVFCGLALLVPTSVALAIEEKRNHTVKALEKLQKKTAELLEERTIKLDSAERQLKDPASSQDRTSDELKKTNVTLQTIIDSLSDSILVIDLNYNLKMINRTARENYLKDQDDPTPLCCYNLSHKRSEPCSSADHRCPIDEVIRTKKQCTVVHKHIRKDGSEVPVEVQASPIFSETGDIIGIIESSRDISSRIIDEEKRKESDLRLFKQQRDQSIATLAGGIAHEFNNILTSVLGNAELLNVRLNEQDPNRKQTDAIIQGSHHLADLTSQLLAYARGGKYQSEKISINKTVKNSLDLTHKGKFGGIGVHLDLAEDIWPVLGDPLQINQLVMNILINGFEALEVTDGVLENHTANLAKIEKWQCKQKEMHPAGEYVHLTVTNTGSEIPAEHLEKIFDPFFSTKFTGRGLGLAAAKGIVQSHDGCINISSSPAGTSFHVLLPKAVFDQEVMATDSEPFVNIKGLRVLAVDDEPQVLSIIENLLTHHGCHVLTADKGSEALEIINRHKDDLDLVVLDIQMPGMSGDEVYRKLKVLNPAIRVLISSGYEEYTALQNIELDARRDRFIKKPFSMVELLQKVKDILLQE
ncbi:MAG: response regulator [Proteobacteria bacterium]|nr:response regulator [Pseudomonadota bacterium]